MSIFDNLLTDKKDNTIIGLTSELKAIYINNNYIKKSKSVILVENSLYEATRIYNILSNYSSNIFLFPMDDFLTSEALALSPELKTKRLETLNAMTNNNNSIIVTNLMGYLRYLPLKEVFNSKKIEITVNEDINMKQLTEKLIELDYDRTATINKTGELALRGFVVDIFPINYLNPVRIEFWGDTIDSIREFDVDTQLTIKKLDSIQILPNTEFILKENKDVEHKQKYLPKYDKVTNIGGYIKNGHIIFDNYSQLKISYERLLDEIFDYNNSTFDKCDNYMHDLYKLVPNDSIFFEDFNNNLNNGQISNIHEIEPFIGNEDNINNRLNKYLKNNNIVVICLSDRYKVNRLVESLNNPNIIFTDENNILDNKINIIIKKISYGFKIDNYVVISECEIFNKKDINNTYKTNFKLGTKIKDISKLEIGDYVVHVYNGIGIYRGIKSLVKNGLRKDYLMIEYKDNDKLYVPVEKIEFINKYSSKEGMVPHLNKLGSSEWVKTKLKAKKRIEDMALELLKLYSEREASVGFAFNKDTEEQEIFESEFSFVPTLDQLRVTEEIKKDMEKKTPMDRLLCGDVGYGKTEVAFRAMFKAIMSNKQVALLCPTTILSSQHYKNSIERFKNYPINIALLNRFISKKETDRIIKDVKEGKIDILIGTHRILSDDIEFKDLGLLVIDEEQRFGVKHKEKIKKYKVNIDVLTLSATPIPRTLQMSMAGIRNLSLIETPPVDRYPIQTYVLEENNSVIKDAIYKELSRDGQIFILYNDISGIEAKAKEINKLAPDARIVFAHGRMEKDKLEDIMQDFVDYKYDILLCTTIIETGIDIPLVNTLIILGADRFGLSQLYQIRGRVGRSNKIAYAYLMYKPDKILSDVATKRLSAIKDFTELGSGFSIAMRDLSIRGAGNILGSEQAGFVDTIGTELFLKMLNEEIEKLKGNEIKEEEKESNLPLIDVETSINDDYILDEEVVIEVHKKINNIKTIDDITKIKEELEDRFGKLNEKVIIYMYEELFEEKASKLQIKKVKQTNNFIEIELPHELTEKLDGELLFKNISSMSRMFRFSLRNNNFIITLDIIKLDKHFIYYLNDLIDVINKSIK